MTLMRRVVVVFLLVATMAAAQTLTSSIKTRLQNAQQQHLAGMPELLNAPQGRAGAAQKPPAARALVVASKAAVRPRSDVRPDAAVAKVPAMKKFAVKRVAMAVAVTAAKKNAGIQGRRDPFVSIIRTETPGPMTCSIGKKCLIVDQIMLRGVVQSQEGMLALVENSRQQSYFLRDGDPVFNGRVVRITRDSIVFRERVMDRRGRELSHDVVKYLPGSRPAV